MLPTSIHPWLYSISQRWWICLPRHVKLVTVVSDRALVFEFASRCKWIPAVAFISIEVRATWEVRWVHLDNRATKVMMETLNFYAVHIGLYIWRDKKVEGLLLLIWATVIFNYQSIYFHLWTYQWLRSFYVFCCKGSLKWKIWQVIAMSVI